MSNQRACDRASPSWPMLFRFSSRSNTILSHPSHRPAPAAWDSTGMRVQLFAATTQRDLVWCKPVFLSADRRRKSFLSDCERRPVRRGRGPTRTHTKEKTPPRVKCPSRYYTHTQSDRPVLFVIPSLPWRFSCNSFYFYFQGVSIEKNKIKIKIGTDIHRQ